MKINMKSLIAKHRNAMRDARFRLAAWAHQHMIVPIGANALQQRFIAINIAMSAYIMRRLFTGGLWAQRISEGMISQLGQRVTLFLGLKCFEAGHFFFKAHCSLLACYMRRLGCEELAHQIAELTSEVIDTRSRLGFYLEIEQRLSRMISLIQPASHGGKNG